MSIQLLFGILIFVSVFSRGSTAKNRVKSSLPIIINNSFLPTGATLLQARIPLLCNTELLSCNESKLLHSDGQNYSVTFYLATRTKLLTAADNNTIATLSDWMFIRNKNLRDKSAKNKTKYISTSSQLPSNWRVTSGKSEHFVLYGRTNKPRTIYINSGAIPYFAEYAPTYRMVDIIANEHNHNNSCNYNHNFDKNHNLCGNNTVYRNAFQRIDNATFFDDPYKSSWDTILSSPLLLHWFVENPVLSHEKVSTMPIGMNPQEGHPDDKSDHPTYIAPLLRRPLKILQIDRVRPLISQFNERTLVHTLCVQNVDTCTAGIQMASHKEFVAAVSTYPFVLCVHGGGIDPSPKAWEALLIGTIPIIEHSPVDDAYWQFPVAFVSNITDFMLWNNKTKVLRHWLQELGPHYEEGSKLREKVLEKLTTKYWWDKVTSYLK